MPRTMFVSVVQRPIDEMFTAAVFTPVFDVDDANDDMNTEDTSEDILAQCARTAAQHERAFPVHRMPSETLPSPEWLADACASPPKGPWEDITLK